MGNLLSKTVDHPLRAWRKNKGLTLAEAAEQVGTNKGVWCEWEYGKRIPNRTYMPRIRELTAGEITADSFYREEDQAR